MTRFTIDVYSDLICPWCYVGRKKLARAMDIYKKVYPGGKKDTFVINHHAYYLKPDASKISTPVDEVHLAKLGNMERVTMMRKRIIRVGAEEGIHFTFAGRTGSTRDAHRLIHYSKSKGRETQDHIVGALYKAFHEEGGDITDLQLLIRVGIGAGLTEKELKKLFKGNDHGNEVDKEARVAKEQHGPGVPRYVIQGEFVVEGAEEPSTFYEIFTRIKA